MDELGIEIIQNGQNVVIIKTLGEGLLFGNNFRHLSELFVIYWHSIGILLALSNMYEPCVA